MNRPATCFAATFGGLSARASGTMAGVAASAAITRLADRIVPPVGRAAGYAGMGRLSAAEFHLDGSLATAVGELVHRGIAALHQVGRRSAPDDPAAMDHRGGIADAPGTGDVVGD